MTDVTFDDLRRFDEVERRGRRHSPLGHVGLNVDSEGSEYARCDETPLDSVVFAYTGGDSVHFCALETAGVASSEWPVVMVVPVCREQPHLVVGATLQEFLALGIVAGYSLLEQLVYDGEKALTYLFDRKLFLDWCYASPAAQREYAAEIAESEVVLSRLAQRFGLMPWSSPATRLAALQASYACRIRVEHA